jgi:hypothetical protein
MEWFLCDAEPGADTCPVACDEQGYDHDPLSVPRGAFMQTVAPEGSGMCNAMQPLPYIKEIKQEVKRSDRVFSGY